MLEDFFIDPERIIGGPEVDFSYIIDSISTDLSFVTGQFAKKNPTMYKNPLTELNMNIATFRLKNILKKLNSVVFSPQVNYTDRATATCRRS
jgi:hypothetical protein